MGFLIYVAIYFETRPSTVFYIMPVIDEMMHSCCLEIICKFYFLDVRVYCSVPEYMKRYTQLFYTFNDILQETFDKTKCE